MIIIVLEKNDPPPSFLLVPLFWNASTGFHFFREWYRILWEQNTSIIHQIVRELLYIFLILSILFDLMGAKMKKTSIFFAVLIAIVLTLSACTGGKVMKSSLERDLSPDISESSLEQLVAGNNTFAFDLYHAMLEGDANQVYSPYSISLAFAMTYAGARGDTASQMADVLGYTLSDNDLHSAFNQLDLDLAARPDQVDVSDDERFELSIANALWGQEDYQFLPEFLDLLATRYGAGMRLVDFQGNPAQARKLINNWVSDQTQKRIKDIIPAGLPDPLTRLALVNAINFNATWQHQFEPNDTRQGTFYLLDGTESTVDMMGMEDGETFSYADGEGWQAIALPYKGGLAEMVIIMPDEGNFEAFDASLSAQVYDGVISSLAPTMVYLDMPKFTFEASYGLSDALVDLGMTDAFDPGLADFSGMDGSRLLYIGDALHKAFIAVDEKGTEAAAATIVLMAMSAMPLEGIHLTIDHPFFFVIRDVPTNTILFMGRVLNP